MRQVEHTTFGLRMDSISVYSKWVAMNVLHTDMGGMPGSKLNQLTDTLKPQDTTGHLGHANLGD